MKLLLTGADQVGKDTFFQFLLEEPFYSDISERFAFADSLKAMAARVYGIRRPTLEKNKDIKFYADNVYSGRDIIKDFAEVINGQLTNIPFISQSGFESPNPWVNSVINKLERSIASINVITDLRFIDEYRTMRRYDPECVVIEIRKAGVPLVEHPFPVDYIIHNDSDLETYREAALNLVERIQMQHLINYSRGQPAQCSVEWFEMRKGIFTASNCYLIRNPNSKFFGKSLDQLVAEKRSTTLPAPLNTPAIRHGKLFEDVAVEYFTRFLKPGTRHNDAALIFNSRYDKLAASPDGFITDDVKPALIEIKCPTRVKIDNLPEYYNDQMQLQMMVTRIPRCYYLAVKFIRAPHLDDIPADAVCGVIKYGSIFQTDDGEILASPRKLFNNKAALKRRVGNDAMHGYFYISEYFMELVNADVKWQQTFLMKFYELREKYDV